MPVTEADRPAAPRANWTLIALAVAAVLAAILAAILLAAPRKDGALDWFSPMVAGGWMAWTLPVALFFYMIGTLLVVFTLLAIRFPETPRVGILRIETTRGDRLFISLLGSAFICIAWLFFAGAPLTGAVPLCLVYAAAVFRWV
jgi:predicted small integral membrane protein